MRSAKHFIIALTIISACTVKKEYTDQIYTKPSIDPNPPLQSLSAEESMKKIFLPKGYTIELVASEPMISEPVSIHWDGNGRMYVAQMNTYMQDADAGNENEPWSRVMMLEDADGDGRMDKSSIFLDSVVLPRIVMPLDDRIIIGETFQRNLYSYRDTNSDGVADEKVLLLEDTVRDNRNLEHQDATMLWSIDNWLYVSNKSFRYRFSNNTLVRDTLIEPLTGQWGVTQDETGRIFLSRAGTEIPALNFQQHPVYGNLELEGRWEESFLEPWPVIGTPDAQGGKRRMREDNTLNRFTGVSGQEVYLGDKMPNAYGDLFIPEPVGRLVRRAKVVHENGKIILSNAYDSAEFLASSDPLFRPVYATTGPDGCLYIVDMYRGIIQEGTWVKKGTYLRSIVDSLGHDKFVQRGRIYRIYHEDTKPSPRPELLSKTAEELLEYLAHPNGWYRMTAQKLIILKNDETVVPALRETVIDNEGIIAKLFNSDRDFGLERLHALWTLEGLGEIDRTILIHALHDQDSRVRIAAIRISESFIKKNDPIILAEVQQLASDKNAEVAQQLILTLRLKNQETKAVVEKITKSFADNEVIQVTAAENLNPYQQEIQAIREKYKLRQGDAALQIQNGYRIFQSNCAACHGRDGRGIKDLGPSLVGSPRLKGDKKITILILLHGLTGPLDGKEYNGPMAPQSDYNDEELADIISYIHEHLNGTGTIWRGQVRVLREEFKERNAYWTVGELEEILRRLR